MLDALVICGITASLMVVFVFVNIGLNMFRRKRLMNEWKKDVEALKRKSEYMRCRPCLKVVEGGRDDN